MSIENSNVAVRDEPLVRQQTRNRTATWVAFDKYTWLPPTLAVLAAAAVYSVTLSFEFVYDDNQQIIINPLVQSGRYLPSYFVTDVWSQWGIFAHSVYYRPAFLTWLLLNFKLFGLNPMWWHLTTLSAHLVATWLVYALTRQITADSYTSFIAALLFGLHPVHVETVAWISGVTDSLLAIFLLASSVYFLRGRVPADRDGGNPMHLVISLAFYALALLTKETAAVFPAIVFVYAWMYGDSNRGSFKEAEGKTYSRRGRAAFAQAFPFFMLLLVYLAVRAAVLKSLVGTVTPLSLRTELGTVPSLALLYVKHLVWPFNLSVFYNTPYVNTPGLWNFVLPLIFIGLLVGVLLWWARRSSAVAVAVAWLVLPILPALKISAYDSGDIFHDRYLYIPSIGFAILIAVGLRQLGSAFAKNYYYAPAVVALMLACLYGFGALRESRYWASDLRLYSRALELTPNHVDAISNMAAELADQRRFEEAIPYYKKAIQQEPDAWKPYHGLSYCYYQFGRYQDALVYIRRAIQLSPDNPVLHLRLAITLIATNRLDEAEDAVRKALTLQTEGKAINLRFQGAETGRDFIYHFTLGDILRRKGDLRGALAEFRAGLADQPDAANAERAQQIVRSLEFELSKAENKR